MQRAWVTMLRFARFSAAALLLLPLACGKVEHKLEQSESASYASSSVARRAATKPMAVADTGSLALMLPDCPSAAPGAQTFVDDAPGGVSLLVQTDTAAQAEEVRERAVRLVADVRAPKRHLTNGSGGGHGPCPEVIRDVTATFEELSKGARITLRANRPGDVEWLRAEARLRAEYLPALAAGGPPRMASCPSAVPGARTDVEPTRDGVVVRVTAAGADAVGDVRARAARAVTEIERRAAMPRPKGLEPQLGTCPIVLEAEKADARNIPDGVEVTLTTSGTRAGALRREASARAARFARAR
jgi:hypothetical protein